MSTKDTSELERWQPIFVNGVISKEFLAWLEDERVKAGADKYTIEQINHALKRVLETKTSPKLIEAILEDLGDELAQLHQSKEKMPSEDQFDINGKKLRSGSNVYAKIVNGDKTLLIPCIVYIIDGTYHLRHRSPKIEPTILLSDVESVEIIEYKNEQ